MPPVKGTQQQRAHPEPNHSTRKAPPQRQEAAGLPAPPTKIPLPESRKSTGISSVSIPAHRDLSGNFSQTRSLLLRRFRVLSWFKHQPDRLKRSWDHAKSRRWSEIVRAGTVNC